LNKDKQQLNNLGVNITAMEEKILGEKVKSLRLYSKMTQQDLADRCGYTKGMISKIENGKVSIPIATLSKIAKALSVKLSWFFEEEGKESLVNIVKEANRRPIVSKQNEFGYQYFALANKKKYKKIETFMVTVPANTDEKQPFVHQEEEFAVVIKGSIDLVYDGQTFTLEEGDSAYYMGEKAHMFRSRNNREAQVLVIFMLN
jgi:transcriptional regulator with XRE-family HTH domain